MHQKPEDVLNAWIGAVLVKDIAVIESLYSYEAVLIPTFSDQIRRTPETVLDYFKTVGGRADGEIRVDITDLQTQELASGIAILGGTYDWRFQENGEDRFFAARFTYVIDPGQEKPILHHHSSAIPGT